MNGLSDSPCLNQFSLLHTILDWFHFITWLVYMIWSTITDLLFCCSSDNILNETIVFVGHKKNIIYVC